MGYIVTCDSDVGRSKKVNQDAIALKHVKIDNNEIVFAVLCDGMGGFEQGELASTSVVMAYMDWFNQRFLESMEQMNEGRICAEWDALMHRMNAVLYEYGLGNSIKLGTTLTTLLLWNNRYYIYNVGDGRVYELASNITQITKDHSWVAREVEEGRMTPEQAKIDKRKNRILRCVGGAPKTSGDFYVGVVPADSLYMLCCDGIRNKVSDEELLYFLHPSCMTEVGAMGNNIKYIFELNKMREENDNMSMIMIKDNDVTVKLTEQSEGTQVLFEKVMVGTNKYIKV